MRAVSGSKVYQINNRTKNVTDFWRLINYFTNHSLDVYMRAITAVMCYSFDIRFLSVCVSAAAADGYDSQPQVMICIHRS